MLDTIFIFISALLTIIVVAYPFLLGIFLSSKLRYIELHDMSKSYYSTVIPVNKNVLSVNFYPLFLVKRLIFCVILIALDGSIYIQAVSMAVLSVGVWL